MGGGETVDEGEGMNSEFLLVAFPRLDGGVL